MQTLPAEVPHISLRDKSNLISWTISNISNFVASFTLPYLLYAPYANLGPRVAFIYGATSTAAIVFTFFFVPELTGRSLEEVDGLFEARVPAWRSRGKSPSPGYIRARLTRLQHGYPTTPCRGSQPLRTPRTAMCRVTPRSTMVSSMSSRLFVWTVVTGNR